MRVLHTSDWHLGHLLHGVVREREHAAFLAWLVEVIEREAIDAVLITGDVFDRATPPVAAEAAFYGFLVAARARRPGLEVVVIGGNHDSPAGLEKAAPLAAELGVRIIGSAPRTPDGVLDPARMVVVLDGAVVAAVPFLRPMDLPSATSATDVELADAVRGIYAEVLAAARAARRPGQALLATGHLHLTGATPSWLSERRILAGGEEALPVDVFPDDLAYVALGHLHKAQRVGRDAVRYAGSPIPLAFAEADYRHQVVVIDLAGESVSEIRTLEVPRALELRRIPRDRAAPLDEVLALIAALPELDVVREPDDEAAAEGPHAAEGGGPRRESHSIDLPLLEVRVALTRPEPHLRSRLEEAVTGKAVRLIAIAVEATGDRAALADAMPGRALADLDPVEVFERKHLRDHREAPAPALRAAFDALLAEVTGTR